MSEPKTMAEVIANMDRAALQLSRRGRENYARYKTDLLTRNSNPDDVEMILTGFIWDEGEAEDADERDE